MRNNISKKLFRIKKNYFSYYEIIICTGLIVSLVLYRVVYFPAAMLQRFLVHLGTMHSSRDPSVLGSNLDQVNFKIYLQNAIYRGMTW